MPNLYDNDDGCPICSKLDCECSKKVPVIIVQPDGDRKEVGYTTHEGRTFVKVATDERHRIENFGEAWGIQSEVIEERLPKVQNIMVKDLARRQWWCIKLTEFKRLAIIKTLSEAFGEQYIVPLTHWNSKDMTPQ